MKNYIIDTAYLSLYVQLITGILGFIGIFIPLKQDDKILKDVLILETIVQFIEFIFYIILIYYFSSLKENITHLRYYDWVITTPLMLISTAFYFMYNNKAKNERIQFIETLIKEKVTFISMISFNTIMLLFGYLGEIKKLNKYVSVILGSIFFFLSFNQLQTFVGDNQINQTIYYIMFSLWALYGVASIMPYILKNTSYNILDLFSKNFYGLFLFGVIVYQSYM